MTKASCNPSAVARLDATRSSRGNHNMVTFKRAGRGFPAGPVTYGTLAISFTAVVLGVMYLKGDLCSRSAVDISADSVHLATDADKIRSRAAATMLKYCDSLECLRRVHEFSSPQSRFNFPHFLVIGWAKCASTSLFEYLSKQPQIRRPLVKEPHFFTSPCPRCPKKYRTAEEPFYVQSVLGARNASIQGAPFTRAAFEATPTYARAGAQLAKRLRQELPWVKVVASLREPISRVISLENMRRGMDLRVCLKEDSDLYECLRRHFLGLDGQQNYSYPLSKWIEEFPREQIMVIQYEKLTSEAGVEVLRELNAFLGLDPAPPGLDTLGHRNNLKKKKEEGWALTREQYSYLVDLVRPDSQQLAELLTESGLGDGSEWMAAWEKVWRENLDSNCDASGQCAIPVT